MIYDIIHGRVIRIYMHACNMLNCSCENTQPHSISTIKRRRDVMSQECPGYSDRKGGHVVVVVEVRLNLLVGVRGTDSREMTIDWIVGIESDACPHEIRT